MTSLMPSPEAREASKCAANPFGIMTPVHATLPRFRSDPSSHELVGRRLENNLDHPLPSLPHPPTELTGVHMQRRWGCSQNKSNNRSAIPPTNWEGFSAA